MDVEKSKAAQMAAFLLNGEIQRGGIDEMSEEVVPEVEMTEPEPAEVVEKETPEPKQTLEEAMAELEETRKALKKANREAADRRKTLEAYEKAEQDRKDAELSEMERLQKQLSESENKLQRLTYQQMQRKIADEVGLPAVFADRIQGDDEDAMRKDAKSLLEAMPQEKKTVIATTNPGDAKRGVTDDQRRAALYRGDPSDPFDTAAARAHGGGVHFVTDKE